MYCLVYVTFLKKKISIWLPFLSGYILTSAFDWKLHNTYHLDFEICDFEIHLKESLLCMVLYSEIVNVSSWIKWYVYSWSTSPFWCWDRSIILKVGKCCPRPPPSPAASKLHLLSFFAKKSRKFTLIKVARGYFCGGFGITLPLCASSIPKPPPRVLRSQRTNCILSFSST